MPETNNKREEQMISVQNEAFLLFQKKNKDYGDAFAKYGPVGVLMRMGDKISRLQSITKSGIVLVNDEKIRDTLIDLHNYSAMAVILLDEEKTLTIEDATYSDVEESIIVNKRYKTPALVGVVLSSLGFVTYRYLVSKRN